MHVFRIFAVSLIIPFITVALCATGSESGNGRGSSQVKSVRRLESSQDASSSNATVQFPSGGKEGNSSIVFEPRDSLPVHPHPLKIEIKSLVKNSTKADAFAFDPIAFEGEGRGVSDWDAISWMISFLMKAMTSYFIVGILNLVLAPFLKRFGWASPSWDITLGNNGKHHLFDLIGSGSIDKFKVSVGGEGKRDEHKDEGWGGGGGQHGGHGGHGGQHPVTGGAQPAGWLSYDQYAMALPYVDKYSQKAAKKSAKFAKKAHKYAQKAHKYAAKAQAYRLQVRPAVYGQLPGLGGGWPAAGGWGG